jgi:hypothetical protein
MRDHIEARLWADHGHQFSEDLHRLFAGVRETFERLAAIQFEAPWQNEPGPAAEGAGPPRLRLAGLAFGAVLAIVVGTLAATGAVETAPLTGAIA